jgi:hypothetical protein
VSESKEEYERHEQELADEHQLARDRLVFVDFAKTVADQKEWISKLEALVHEVKGRVVKLEELIRGLVKFTGHDPACVRLSPSRGGCNCGFRKLYERIDELID